MLFRRSLTAAIAVAVAAGLLALLVRVVAPGGWTLAKLLMLIGLAGQGPWVGLSVANGTIGFLRLLRGLKPPPPSRDPLPPTAIVVTVRNEALAAVLVPLRHLLDDLAASGRGAAFAAFVLSDSDPGREAAECAACAGDSRIAYRRRPGNGGFKAGNIMDFVDRDAAGFALMLVLDADSAMSAAAVGSASCSI